MKRCPECRRDYTDETLNFCLDDGSQLLDGPAKMSELGAVATGFRSDEPQTAILSEPPASAGGPSASENPTRSFIHTTAAEAEPRESLGGATEKQSFSANRAPGPRVKPQAKPQEKTQGIAKRWLYVAMAGVILLVCGYFAYRYFSNTAGSSLQIESIAVMPFVNDSGNPEMEYLSDGMTETLITSLSHIPSLKVKARSAVFRYKGKDADLRTVAKELGVQALLTGHVLQRGDQLSLRLELIDAATEDVLWADKFDRATTDILWLPNDIVESMLAKMKATLSGVDTHKRVMLKPSTLRPNAYQFYVKGRYLWNKRGADNIKKAVEQFGLATAADPHFALAFAGLADCYAILGDYQDSSEEVITQARENAKRAIELNDDLAEPHATLAILNMQKFRWGEAEQELRRAFVLDRNYPTGVQWYASILLDFGRLDEATAQYKRAYDLDSMSGAINDGLVNAYQARGDHQRAVEAAEKFTALDPTFPGIYADLGLSYLMLGRNDDAVKAAEKAAELSGRESWALGKLGFIYASVGEKKKAVALLEELKTRAERSGSYGRLVAAIYAGLGDLDQAFEWLRKDFEHSSGRVLEVRWDVPYTEMRKDPRFKEIMKRANVPE